VKRPSKHAKLFAAIIFVVLAASCSSSGETSTSTAPSTSSAPSSTEASPTADGGEELATSVPRESTTTETPPADESEESPVLASCNLGFEGWFIEGVSSTADGSQVFVGSVTTGGVARFEGCDAEPSEWVPAGTFRNVIGTFVDTNANLLWVCDSDFSGQAPPELSAVSLESAEVVSRHVFPAPGGFCNDIAMDGDGNVYATDSMAHRILRVDAADVETSGPADVWLQEPRFGDGVGPGQFGLNGIVFDGAEAFFVANFQLGELYSVPLGPDGSPGVATVFASGLAGPDGVEFVDGQVLVVEGGAGRVSSIDGDANRKTLVENLDVPTTATVIGDALWVVEAQLDHMSDPSLGPPDLPLQISAFPLAS